MTITHHPSDVLLTASAAGTLGLGAHIPVATHVQGCARCRQWMRMTETLGGAVLENLQPTAMTGDAMSLLQAGVARPAPAVPAAPVSSLLADVPGLPAFVRRYTTGSWKSVARGLSLLPLDVADTGDMRVFLLKSKPGVKLWPHAHTGVEMTCVLRGSFSHDGERFGPGDFDCGETTTDHTIAIGTESDCVCLVAMSGKLKLKGLLGRMMQPFVAI